MLNCAISPIAFSRSKPIRKRGLSPILPIRKRGLLPILLGARAVARLI
jgi:hypothetical protein